NSVRLGNVGGPNNPEPKWSPEAVKRGFAVVPRPTLPQTYDHYQPLPEEIDQPMVITAAPGQYASKVLFIKALKNLGGPLVVGPKGRPQLNGPHGMYIWAADFVEYRVNHPLKIGKNAQQWEMRPHYLMPGTQPEGSRRSTRTVQVTVPKGEGRSVWVTVFVPEGMAPGDYKGEIHVVAPGKEYSGKPGKNDGHALPFTVRVRDLELLEPDATFGMYESNSRARQLPATTDYRSYVDKRRHGMNAVDQGETQIWRYTDSEGKTRINFSAFDHCVEQMAKLGMRSFFYYCGVPSNPYGAGTVPYETQMAILNRCREKGWPEPLFYVGDEPSGGGRKWAEAINRHYGAARRATFALGYSRLGTYTLPSEGGASLRASGWKLLGERGGGNWSRPSR
ncbi:hypothetical protein LCGC14_2870800, partial [marine sediment metagenome]